MLRSSLALILLVFTAPRLGDVFADDPESSSAEMAMHINRLLADHWAERSITPAQMCSDEQFVRRVYLDLAGRIPRIEESRTFVADQRPDKRQKLVELLLGSEDYVQHFTDVFDTLLMGRGSERDYGERQKHQWRAFLERMFRENLPWNEVAANILLARPSDNNDRGAIWYLYERKEKYQEIAESVAPAFFGIRIECAQCHDHMMAHEIEQQHYWGLVAFFNRSNNIHTKNGPRVSESAIGGFSDFATLEGDSRPNLLTFFEAKTVDETRPSGDEKQEDSDELYLPAVMEHSPRVPKFSRRQQFVDEVLAHHPLVARAFVNRTWAMLMGRGIVHPFDEMDSVHPPSHPKLLDSLADDFRQSGYDIRRLVQTVVMTDAYQLSSIRPNGVDDPATFAWYLERPLTAEQLARSFQLVVRKEFANDSPLVGKVRQALPDVMPEVNISTIRDALFLTNNDALNRFIEESQQPEHLIEQCLQLPDHEQRVKLIVETAFGRTPSAEETHAIGEYLGVDSSSLQHRLAQVVWSVVTSAEFRFNH